MAEPRGALPETAITGAVTVRVAPPRGMITLRGDLASAPLVRAVAAVGAEMPARRRVAPGRGACAALWMSPDEVLLMLPRDEVADTLAQVRAALTGAHALAVDVSDARAVFTLSDGPVREVLARLCPADLHPAALPPGEVRRTRAGQVAAAFWLADERQVTLVCFRSVARYMLDLLTVSARDAGGEGLFPTP